MTEYEAVHVVIDDDAIRRLDVWQIIDPVWWTADFWGAAETYERTISEKNPDMHSSEKPSSEKPRHA